MSVVVSSDEGTQHYEPRDAEAKLAQVREWAESPVPTVIPRRYNEANGYRVAQDAVLGVLNRKARIKETEGE